MSHAVAITNVAEEADGIRTVSFSFDGEPVAAAVLPGGAATFISRPASVAAGGEDAATEAVVAAGINHEPPIDFTLVTFPQAVAEVGQQSRGEPEPAPQEPEPAAQGAEPDADTQVSVDTDPVLTEADGAITLGTEHEDVVSATIVGPFGYEPSRYSGEPAPEAPPETVGADVASNEAVVPPHVAASLLNQMPGSTLIVDDEEEVHVPVSEDEQIAELAATAGVSAEDLAKAIAELKAK